MVFRLYRPGAGAGAPGPLDGISGSRGAGAAGSPPGRGCPRLRGRSARGPAGGPGRDRCRRDCDTLGDPARRTALFARDDRRGIRRPFELRPLDFAGQPARRPARRCRRPIAGTISPRPRRNRRCAVPGTVIAVPRSGAEGAARRHGDIGEAGEAVLHRAARPPCTGRRPSAAGGSWRCGAPRCSCPARAGCRRSWSGHRGRGTTGEIVLRAAMRALLVERPRPEKEQSPPWGCLRTLPGHPRWRSGAFSHRRVGRAGTICKPGRRDAP